MAFIRVRGPRNDRKAYAEYKDPNGTRRTRLLKVNGVPCRTKDEGKAPFADILFRLVKGKPGMEEDETTPPEEQLIGPRMREWISGLTNRNAKQDRVRAEKDVLPYWEKVTMVAGQEVVAVMRWLEDLKKHVKEKLMPTYGEEFEDGITGEQTRRHIYNILSRFWTWCVKLGYAQINPCRSIPNEDRPIGRPPTEGPWIQEDELFWKLFDALPEPVNLVFWMSNQSTGARPGEVRALRLKDFATMDDDYIMICGSARDTGIIGPLKEDKRNLGVTKPAPAHKDMKKIVGLWLKKRAADGAGPDDLAFVPGKHRKFRPRLKYPKWKGLTRSYVQACWKRAKEALGITYKLGLYEATRHTWISRNLENGVPLTEVQAAIHHASLDTTKRYNRYKPKGFNPIILGQKPGKKSRPAGPPNENEDDDPHRRT